MVIIRWHLPALESGLLSARRVFDHCDCGRCRATYSKRGAVLIDVAIDQGGCFETSRATTHNMPIFEVDGIIHYCVANMPGAVPQTSSVALNNATLPFGLALAGQGLAALSDPHLRNGLNVHLGKITNRGELL